MHFIRTTHYFGEHTSHEINVCNLLHYDVQFAAHWFPESISHNIKCDPIHLLFKLYATPSNCEALRICSLASWELPILRLPTLCRPFNAFHIHNSTIYWGPNPLVLQYACPKPVAITTVRETHTNNQSWSLSFKLRRDRTYFSPQLRSLLQSQS